MLDKWITVKLILVGLVLTTMLYVTACNQTPDSERLYEQGMSAQESVQKLKLMTEAAKLGSVNAMAELANMYMLGEAGLVDNDGQVEFWLKRAAENGDAQSQYGLALVLLAKEGLIQKLSEADRIEHYYDDGVPEDKEPSDQTPSQEAAIEEADHWMMLAAENGHPNSQDMQGQKSKGKGDYKAAIEWFQKAAEQGYVGSMINLAEIFLESPSSPFFDPRTGLAWLKKAVESNDKKGSTHAAAMLGHLYARGVEIEPDYDKAAKYYLDAAENGHPLGQLGMAMLYASGDGVEQDDNKSAYWFEKAAERGIREAQYSIGIRYIYGRGVERNIGKAVSWLKKAANTGDPMAQYTLGQLYGENGLLPRDDAEAAKWYKLAAEQGHSKAQSSLGLLYILGTGVERDIEEAKRLARLAANQGDGAALAVLGIYEEDSIEKSKWFRLAKWAGNRKVDVMLEITEESLNQEQREEAQRRVRQWIENWEELKGPG